MKVKVSEAEGQVLDWLVAKIEEPALTVDGFMYEWGRGNYSASVDWSEGGPIIAGEKIDVTYQLAEECWCASGGYMTDGYTTTNGPTPLMAAMRCFVASRIGDEVDVPKVLA